MSQDDVTFIDISRWDSVGAAIEAVDHPRPFEATCLPWMERYTEAGGDLSLEFLFFTSALARARALHEAIVREIKAENPPASVILLRQLSELVALVFYVGDHPNYVEAIAFLS